MRGVGCHSRSHGRLFHCVPPTRVLGTSCTGRDRISPKPLLDQIFVQVFALFTVASNCAFGVDGGGGGLDGCLVVRQGRVSPVNFWRVKGGVCCSRTGRDSSPVNQKVAAAQGTEKVVFRVCVQEVVCGRLQSLFHVWTLEEGQWLYSMARAKDLHRRHLFLLTHSSVLRSLSIEVILKHVLSSLSIYGMDLTPCISLPDQTVIVNKYCMSFVYRMRSTANCFRIGKVCFKASDDLTHISIIADITMWPFVLWGCLSYCD